MWIISKIRNDNSSKMLLANFTYLSIIEIIGLLLPLITFPYLIRTIGAQKYGIIVFAQTIVAYLVMIVNFGFNVSATRRISENRHNINKINEIYSSVIFQKLLIFIIALVVTIIIYYNWFNWFMHPRGFIPNMVVSRNGKDEIYYDNNIYFKMFFFSSYFCFY